MGKRGRRRALCENKKDEDESYYYDDSFDEHTANLKNTTNIENIYSKTEENLFKCYAGCLKDLSTHNATSR